MITDQIKALCYYYRVPTSLSLGAHAVMDDLDDAAGINTKWQEGHDGCCMANVNSYGGCRRLLGARVALHEKHMRNNIIIGAIFGGRTVA